MRNYVWFKKILIFDSEPKFRRNMDVIKSRKSSCTRDKHGEYKVTRHKNYKTEWLEKSS